MDVQANKPRTRNITKHDLNHLILSRVKLTSDELGQGSYGTVYKSEYNGTSCAAKTVDLINVRSQRLVERVKQNFLLECLQHSKLSHPNIVKMLGVFYPKKAVLPFLVMELMDYNLTQLLKSSHNIIMYVKLSILQDVSRGLCYLHAQNPPIVHQALYSDNILISKGLIAKIADFKSGAETVSEQALISVRRNRGSNDFLPDSLFILKYDMPLNVFSFGCVMCHVITQEWPSTLRLSSAVPYLEKEPKIKLDDYCPVCVYITKSATGGLSTFPGIDTPVVRKCYTIDDWSVNKHQDYIDLISDNSLKQLVEACLQCKSKNRPHMSLVYDRITSLMTGEFRYFVYCNYQEYIIFAFVRL